jgi:hypothetical protein
MTFQWIFEEQPVYAHSFVVGHQVMMVAGLRKEYVVWKYGVRFSFTFKHKRPSSTEAHFDASIMDMLRERLPVCAVLRETDCGYAL